jgi:hypothetical protein
MRVCSPLKVICERFLMPVYPESLARRALRSLVSYRYHRDHVTQAKRILKRVEGVKGSLSQQLVRQCDDYARDVLGHSHFAGWLYVYSTVAGRFKEGWIPDNYYGAVVVPKLKGNYGKLSKLKPLNSMVFSNGSFPDILSYSNGVFFDTQYRVLHPEYLIEKLFTEQDKVVYKLNDSSRGKGIFFFDRESFDLLKIYKLGNGLFQRFIHQHEVFQEFTRDSVATIRMTTVLADDGTTSLRACYLRLGTGSDTHVQSKSHIRIPIDLKSGAFHNVGFTTDWLEIDCHPTGKVKFQGKFIPAYDDCLKLVTTLHKRVPFTRCIGWDLAVDNMLRVRIMEWNGEHNDIKFSEATQGPCFSDLHWEQLKD